MAVNTNGKEIVPASDDRILRAEVERAEGIGKPPGRHEDSLTSLSVNKGGENIFSELHEKKLRIWRKSMDRRTGGALRGREINVAPVALSRDGKNIVYRSWDNTTRIRMGTGECARQSLRGRKMWVNSVAVSDLEKTIVSGSG